MIRDNPRQKSVSVPTLARSTFASARLMRDPLSQFQMTLRLRRNCAWFNSCCGFCRQLVRPRSLRSSMSSSAASAAGACVTAPIAYDCSNQSSLQMSSCEYGIRLACLEAAIDPRPSSLERNLSTLVSLSAGPSMHEACESFSEQESDFISSLLATQVCHGECLTVRLQDCSWLTQHACPYFKIDAFAGRCCAASAPLHGWQCWELRRLYCIVWRIHDVSSYSLNFAMPPGSLRCLPKFGNVTNILVQVWRLGRWQRHTSAK